jgi:hypothetical protein
MLSLLHAKRSHKLLVKRTLSKIIIPFILFVFTLKDYVLDQGLQTRMRPEFLLDFS